MHLTHEFGDARAVCGQRLAQTDARKSCSTVAKLHTAADAPVCCSGVFLHLAGPELCVSIGPNGSFAPYPTHAGTNSWTGIGWSMSEHAQRGNAPLKGSLPTLAQ